MKQFKAIVAFAVVWFSFAGIAHAVSITKKIANTTSVSSSANSSSSTSILPTGYCDLVRYGLMIKSTSSSTKPKLYAYTGTTATATEFNIYLRTDGSELSKANFYMLDITPAANAPYTKMVLTFAAGFTGTTEVWCTYGDGSR